MAERDHRGAALCAASAGGTRGHDARRPARGGLLRRRRACETPCAAPGRARRGRCCWTRSLLRLGRRRSRHCQPAPLADSDPVTIIYTSGTSGESKGVVLTAGNVTYMLSCTTARLDLLMGRRAEPDRVFHYLPFCFAGSWILLLSCLSRSSELRLSHGPDAPGRRSARGRARLLPERAATARADALGGGGPTGKTRRNDEQDIREGESGFAGARKTGPEAAYRCCSREKLIFPAIRKKLGPNLKALICGSAPLALETQLFFMMLGHSRAAGLRPHGNDGHLHHGRSPARRAGHRRAGHPRNRNEAGRGRTKFWCAGRISFRATGTVPKRPPRRWRTAGSTPAIRASRHRGGNWRIIGRLKNLLILSSGHNIAPEPLEEKLARAIPAAQQVVVFGHGRSFLSALVTGEVQRDQVEAEIAQAECDFAALPPDSRFHIEPQPLTIESGLLTANGKLRRDAIAAHFRDAIESMYRKNPT